MKIRHVVLTASFAGAEQHVCVLANEQVRHGHAVEVWGGDPVAMRRRLHSAVTHRDYGNILAAVCGARRVPHVDIVHAHMTKAEVAAILSVGSQTPVIATRHFAAVRGQSPAGHLARPVLRNRISRQIAVSEFVASRIDGESVVVYAGVEAQTRLDSPRSQTILVAQRLSPEKRTADALDAFSESGLHRRGWRMEIAGRGEQHDALVRHTANLGLADSVTFLGFTHNLPSRMRQASILLATTPADAFGLTVVEAMSHATPVVATASGGHLESVGRVSPHFMYEPGNSRAAGVMLAALGDSESQRREYGEALRAEQVARFTPERQYAATQQIYDEAVGDD